jgi:hypothetical protein
VLVEQHMLADEHRADREAAGVCFAPRPDWTATNDRIVHDALLDLLALGPDGSFLVFTADRYYVQFFKELDNDKLVCEAMSGRYAPRKSPPLPKDAARQLLNFGFTAPTRTLKNFHRTGPLALSTLDMHAIATMVVSIMRDVYCVRQDRDIVVQLELKG